MECSANCSRLQRGNCNRSVTLNPTQNYRVEVCDRKENECAKKPVGIGYVTVQEFANIYPLDKALMVGTIFQQLDYPFAGSCCNSKFRGGRV